MELGQLEGFVTVAREGSFTRAAERLNLTQPSLSARIGQLEASLGGQLFRRDTRPVRLTVMGELFLPYAVRALGILDAGREALRAAHRGLAGRVVIGCSFSLATYLIPQVVNRFSQAYPQAELVVETTRSNFVAGQLVDGLVNLAFAAAFPSLVEQTHTLLRLHDEMIVAVAPEHPLAQTKNVSVSDLFQYRLLLPGWGPAFEAFVSSLRQMSGGMGPAMRVPFAAALPMARQPDTITFLPRRLAAASGLAEVDVPGIPFPWDVVLITRPGRTLTGLEQAFVTIVEAVWRSTRPEDENVKRK